MRRSLLQQFAPAHGFGDRTQTKLREQMANILGQSQEVIDDMLRLAAEFGTQFRTLCSDARRASVEMTLPCHIATERHQRSCAKSELLCAQERGDYDISRGA